MMKQGSSRPPFQGNQGGGFAAQGSRDNRDAGGSRDQSREGGGREGSRDSGRDSAPGGFDIRSKRRKRCPFTAAGIKGHEIDFKDIETLSKFITERGKISPRRITGVSAHHQNFLALAIKRARHMALLPFVAKM